MKKIFKNFKQLLIVVSVAGARNRLSLTVTLISEIPLRDLGRGCAAPQPDMSMLSDTKARLGSKRNV